MAITAVGTLAKASGIGQKTVSVSPTTLGDILVLSVLMQLTVNTVTAVSGGGVTTWHRLIGSTPSVTSGDAEIWWGVVTATGAGTITITTGTGTTNGLVSQQFTAGAGMLWSADTPTSSNSTGTVAASGTWGSIAPTGAGELFLGNGYFHGGSAGGATSGFVYAAGVGGYGIAGCQFVYHLSAPNPSAPAWSQTSGTWVVADGFLIAVPSTGSTEGLLPFL